MISQLIHIGLFAVETFCSFTWLRHERYIYLFNNTIRFFKAQNESYHMTYAVKTVEHLFTRCGHERYTMMTEDQFFFHEINHD